MNYDFDHEFPRDNKHQSSSKRYRYFGPQKRTQSIAEMVFDALLEAENAPGTDEMTLVITVAGEDGKDRDCLVLQYKK